jgi:DNA-binding transcriptional regulator YiaG
MRKELGLKATELADILNVSPETVSRWENGAAAVDRIAWILVAEVVRQPDATRAATLERLRAWPKRPTETRLVAKA